MTQIGFHLDLYKIPSNEILRHRKEFYGLWKRCDDQSTTWLNRVQSKINHCRFPPVMSREYLLIDKFVCALDDDDEREYIQSVSTWTLSELKKYFEQRKVDTGPRIPSINAVSNTTFVRNKQEMPTFRAVKCGIVS